MRSWRCLHTAGFVKPLYADFGISCGDVEGGIGLRFGNDGGGVVSLEDLAKLVADAFEARGDAQQVYELQPQWLTTEDIAHLRECAAEWELERNRTKKKTPAEHRAFFTLRDLLRAGKLGGR